MLMDLIILDLMKHNNKISRVYFPCSELYHALKGVIFSLLCPGLLIALLAL